MADTKTVYRWWWVWNFEKEERWLNDMAAEGWLLNSVGFCRFHFVRCEPGEYLLHIEMRAFDDPYLDLMKECGAEYIGRVVQWVYFRKKAEYGVFELNSDIDSRIAHLDRIAKMLLIIGIANITIGIANSLNASRMGAVNLLCGCLLMYALGRIRGKRDELSDERSLHE